MTVGHRGEKVQVQHIRVWTCQNVGVIVIVVSSCHVSIIGQVMVGEECRLDLVELAAHTSTLAIALIEHPRSVAFFNVRTSIVLLYDYYCSLTRTPFIHEQGNCRNQGILP